MMMMHPMKKLMHAVMMTIHEMIIKHIMIIKMHKMTITMLVMMMVKHRYDYDDNACDDSNAHWYRDLS